MTMMRTEYWNRSTNTVRGGPTGHGESLTDMESYLLPLDQIRDSSLHGWGVARGLAVSAAPGATSVQVSTGTAVDASGRVIALAEGGLAVVDPDVDPHQPQNVPTVPVGADGLAISTGTATGDRFLTVTWAEVIGENQLVLFHAPWLRLQPTAGFQDSGDQIVLALLTLDAGGAVRVVSAGPRRAVPVFAGRVELRCPRATASPEPHVEQVAVAELAARDDGGVDVDLLASDGGRWTAVSVAGTGRVGIGARDPTAPLEVDGGADDAPAVRLVSSGTGRGAGLLMANSGARAYGVHAGSDGSLHLTDQTAQADRLVVDGNGNVGVGVAAGQARRILHVSGDEVHSGGLGAGFSFADRGTSAFVDNPAAGERWVWYAQGGSARLWSGVDRLTISPTGEGGGLDVPRRMRVRQGGDWSAGIWFYQSAPQGDRAFVGMVDDDHVGLWGNNGGTWGLQMNTANGWVGIGIGKVQRPLHVWGSEIHSGGSGAGFSFEDRLVSGLVETPWAGERWVWYAYGGSARLWSGVDRLTVSPTGEGGGLDVPRRMRVRQGGDGSAGIWLFQDAPNADRAFIGMSDDTHLGFWGNNGAWWGLQMNTASGNVSIGQTPPYSNVRLRVEGSDIGLTARARQAAIFYGNVTVSGVLQQAGAAFRIDHPVDPATRYLVHSAVASPEMLTVYTGTATTDDSGTATVALPEFFEALNRDCCYQLTPIGEQAQAVVAEEVRDNAFTIRTDRPGVRVSWQITGVRQDVWARAHRIDVEETKPAAELNSFLHPELHGHPASSGVPSSAADEG
ncbi:hypothetical protein GCM10025787_24960 [Saccharopolyspora rosea]|uniref:Uncharacterized protein n=2 Tax=Saccharopolyspora rosea TaxID=524884 RepID=A0ABW3FQK2_9PSEU